MIEAKNDIFCQIIKGKAPASIIDQTKRVIVITSLEGYPLVIPKKHIVDIFDPNLDDFTVKELGLVTVWIARLTKEVFGVDSVTTLSANGIGAGQEVIHYHTHIIPRTEGDKRVRVPRLNYLPREELDRIVTQYRSAMHKLKTVN